jgi:hypothetical protein
MSNRPVVLGAGLVERTLGDTQFLERVPEFRALKPKLKAMKLELSGGGCSGCKKRRVQRGLFGDYLTVVRSLSPEALGRFKRAIGAGSVMFNEHDRTTNKVKTQIL